ncbi:hypothetical protein LAV83_21600 [Rhizobium sp. VS19-DRK62.2]|uniref:hypothetical protein n=1 Tax=unclassified Rhizobium TaxID=2613769 RepID=UPI001CC5EA90|nr:MULTISPECIES: hypothetical protein [unclassified Rhizobium]MBZ5761960.1 hypothetical protein [Rhizobium sp. VS19-DR96]MBZ5768932.1 hypothetical protein [Rhizobium sp. VS19-DR129.2]MBZ5775664.1 hypothetical protein [Rhizobium sp. VS19-DRK62.2]MBZ5786838.1 hypothetical protein [Rhizobium sp. VS19-DR121]MBZ5805048.1 hypothetical protein [Rhizobium sp. VS19-DR181]
MVQRAPARRRKKTNAGPDGMMTMFVLKTNPFAEVDGFSLPSGARVAVVTSKPAAARSVARRLAERIQSDGFLVRVAQAETGRQETPRTDAKAGIDRSAFEPDARSKAILQGVRISQSDLKAAGGAYDLEEVQVLLNGITRQAVDKRVQEGSLLAVPGPSNRRRYPTLQFDRSGVLIDGLKEVQAVLPVESPWGVLNFLAREDDRLSRRRPIDVLREGNIALVVDAARRFGEQGA